MKKAIIILLVFIFSASFAYAQEKTIVAAADPWPPFTDPSSPQQGISLEIVRAAYKTQGYTVEMNFIPWARAEGMVKAGKYDILPVTWMTNKRKEYLLYSDAYVVNELKFIKQKDDPFEYNGISSLDGKKVGVVRGYGYGDEFQNADNFKREHSDSFISNIKKLVYKRIDLTLEDEIVARTKITEKDSALLPQIRFTKSALSSNPLHVTSGLKNPRHKEIIEAFNKGLAEIKANGDYSKILKKYGIE